MCGVALTCNAVSCKSWRWKDTAQAKGETQCLCGRDFTVEIYKPFPAKAKGAKGTKAEGSDRAPGAQAKAKAKAKPKTQPKAGEKPAPWGGRSATERRSAYQLLPEAAEKAAKDDVALAEEQLKLLEAMRRTDKLPEARRQLAEARRLQQERLPPRERLQHLKKELEEAEGELETQERAVAETENQLQELETQLNERRAAVTSAAAKCRRLEDTIDQVERNLPPETEKSTTAEASAEGLNQVLLQAQTILRQLQGSELAAETQPKVAEHLRALQSLGEDADKTKRQAAQEAQDAVLAASLQAEKIS